MSHGSSLRNCGGTRQDRVGKEKEVERVIRHSSFGMGSWCQRRRDTHIIISSNEYVPNNK